MDARLARDLDAWITRTPDAAEPDAPACSLCECDEPQPATVALDATGAAWLREPVGTLVCEHCAAAICEDVLRHGYLRALDAADHCALDLLARRWERRSRRAPTMAGIASVAGVLS